MFEIIEPDGEMTLLDGPPFTFQVLFMYIDKNIDHFHFKEITLQTDTGEKYNLFEHEKKEIELQYYTGLFYLKDEENAAESYSKTRKVEIPNRF